MPQIRRFPDDDALLSLDFIVGFTIFMLAFIFVATMMSGILIGLQSKTIDYDAVAYRTGVVLVEDPGEPPIVEPGKSSNWALIDKKYPVERDRILRLGLSYNKFYPGILSPEKIDRFFEYSSSGSCSGQDVFCYPADYRQKLIFGDYPYQFNISVKEINQTGNSWSIGEPVNPESRYGYIRRVVMVKDPGYLEARYNNGTISTQIISMNFSEYYGQDIPYRIDPLNEKTYIFFNTSGSFTTSINSIQVCLVPTTPGGSLICDTPSINEVYWGPPVSGNSTVIIEPRYLSDIGANKFSLINLSFTFNDNISVTQDYSYYNPNVTTPGLEPAVLEVRIW